MYRARSRRLAQYQTDALSYIMTTKNREESYDTETNGCRIDDTHYALVNENTSGYINLNIYSINSNGRDINLLGSIQSTYVGDSSKIMYLGNSTLIMSFTRSNGRGYLEVYTFDSSYTLTRQTSTTFITTNNWTQDLKKIDDTHFLLVYYDRILYVYVTKIYSINSSYTISLLTTRNEPSDLDNYDSIVFLDTTHYAVLYTSEDDLWRIGFYFINGSYSISVIQDVLLEVIDKSNSGSMTLLEPGLLGIFKSDSDNSGLTIEIVSYNQTTYQITIEDRERISISIGNNWFASETIDSRHFISFYKGEDEYPKASIVFIDDNLKITNLSTITYDEYETSWILSGFKLTKTLYIGINSTWGSQISILIT